LFKVASSESKELEVTRNNHSGIVEIPLGSTTMNSGINEPTVTSIIIGSRQPNLEISVDAVSENIESKLLAENNPTKLREEEPQRSTYQLDKDGYLQDDSGQYILDPENKFIVLSPEQIEALR